MTDTETEICEAFSEVLHSQWEVEEFERLMTDAPEPEFAKELRAALKSAGINAYVRRFHRLRHSSLTNVAAAGSNPIASMTKAGHSSMSTTRINLHLAGQVFRPEADALEQRLLGGRTFCPSEATSDDVASPDTAVQAVSVA